MLQSIIHYGIHFLVPLLVALIWFKDTWLKAYLIMLACFLIDIDHFFANPMFDPNRCSINFHPLHSYYAIAIYVLLLIQKKTRILGLGLVIHILADSADCLLM
ncbi:DUF6122 family protein [Formosa maritima]|uniref:Metal-dependent hydrolase n=1 Tax=Formosa maritima TaxID=2592046 RepID=A0A5D0G3X0_9FLAO|nr:DUF6122 family protein [Formosa maritima]TYA53843.1 hypothetical protein FVF61_09525 [Formosa maritima]